MPDYNTSHLNRFTGSIPNRPVNVDRQIAYQTDDDDDDDDVMPPPA